MMRIVRHLVIATLLVLSLAAAGDVPTIQPQDLAAIVRTPGSKIVVVQVGPNLLYRGHHIPGSLFGGPAGKPEGLELLKTVVKDVPRDTDLYIYCGCCPWEKCPNINPAIALLKKMGFDKVKAMYSGTNFKTDWIDQGFPVEPPIAP